MSVTRVLMLVALGISGFVIGVLVRDSGRSPNLLVVTVDSFRLDHSGTWGYPRDTTPSFDSLARGSIVFDQHIATMAASVPNHVALFTGRHPIETGVWSNPTASRSPVVPEGLPNLAHSLYRAGYHTSAFVAGSWMHGGSGVERGFAHFDVPEAVDRLGEETTNRAISWLSERPNAPFFAWVHLADPRAHYQPPDEFDVFQSDDMLVRWLNDREMLTGENDELVVDLVNAYDGELRYSDAQIGRITEALVDFGLWENTIVVVLGTHGEGLLQHGHLEHGLTWDEHLHTPLIMRIPAIPAGRFPHVVSTVDVISMLGGVTKLPGLTDLIAEGSGVDALAPEFEPGTAFSMSSSESPSFYGHTGEFAVTSHKWKYVWASRRESLYDRVNDPHELVNLRRERVSERDSLRQIGLDTRAVLEERGAEMRGESVDRQGRIRDEGDATERRGRARSKGEGHERAVPEEEASSTTTGLEPVTEPLPDAQGDVIGEEVGAVDGVEQDVTSDQVGGRSPRMNARFEAARDAAREERIAEGEEAAGLGRSKRGVRRARTMRNREDRVTEPEMPGVDTDANAGEDTDDLLKDEGGRDVVPVDGSTPVEAVEPRSEQEL